MKVEQKLKIIRSKPLRITIAWEHMPGGSEHNLMCWLCQKRKAVYSMYPYWMFIPCWNCQKEIQGEGIWNIKKKKWYQFWK